VPGAAAAAGLSPWDSLAMPEPKNRLRFPSVSPPWSTETILPEGFLPMLPTAAAGPLDSPEYGYEVKWEGLRVLLGMEACRLYLRSGAGQDAALWFPELSKVRAAAEPTWVLLDGELVVLHEGRPSFAHLQQRLQAADRAAASALARQHPVTFVAYDILRIGDSWLLDVTWEERREILQQTLTLTREVQFSPVWDEGRDALARGAGLGLEAVVAKRLRGKYAPGEKTRDWLTIKPLEVVEAVVCGWTAGRGARGSTIGTLLLGAYDGGELVYVGHTGTGLDAETLRTLHADLQALAQPGCPCRNEPPLQAEPHWTRPEIVCRVRHQGWTADGRMRAPTFLARVDDRAPRECRLVRDAAPAGG
jgi:bifunctional non-homologous end joining protein LigD